MASERRESGEKVTCGFADQQWSLAVGKEGAYKVGTIRRIIS
jgi:hypothetical protein